MEFGNAKPPSAVSSDPVSFRRDVIDEHLFVEALALTAFEITYQDPQPSNADKVSTNNNSLIDYFSDRSFF